jgi:general secretion pathway protein K
MLLVKRIHGGALLTALFIMTLIAIVATAMSSRLQLDIYRTQLAITHDKLYLASQAVTFWALSELNTSEFKVNKPFPPKMSTIYPQIILSGELYDLQGRFNLNNLTNKKSFPSFTNLMGQAYPRFTNNERIKLLLAIKDWIAPYDLSRGKDDYTAYYLSQKPPYYPSHQLFASVSELRLIQDVSAAFYLAIEPLVTVLPEPTPININTASKNILMTLGNGLDEEQVEEIIQARGKKGFKNLNEISELLKKLDVPNEQVTLESQYFFSFSKASTKDSNLTIYTLLKRSKDKNGKLSASIIRESINGM